MHPDLTLATRLAEQGYWIFPCSLRQKGPRKLADKPWGWFMEQNQHALLSSFLAHNEVTGAAICLTKDDKTPLLALDFDLEQAISWEDLWRGICPDDPIPTNLGVTQTISGGYHFWFQLPEGRFPTNFHFSDVVHGEIRASSLPKAMLMLPGSVALNKQGQPGRYQAVNGDITKPESLPFPPAGLVGRLQARRGEPTQQIQEETDGIPTEVGHFLELLKLIPPIAVGAMNTTVAQVGQIIGRMHPREEFPESLRAKIYSILKPKLDAAFDIPSFIKAINSGWKTGRNNAGKYQLRDKFPTASDVDTECRAIFGAELWMKRLVNSQGKEEGILVGIGGSSKRPHEASVEINLASLEDLLPYLSKAANVDPNLIVRNPLFIQPGWKRVLDFLLKSRSTVEPLGLPPEEIFEERLNECGIQAARDGYIVEGWADKRPWEKNTPFLICPRVGGEQVLVIPEVEHERLLRSIGDIALAKRLSNQRLLKKNLTGRAKGWTIASTQLEPRVQQLIRSAYEALIARKMS